MAQISFKNDYRTTRHGPREQVRSVAAVAV